MLINFDDLDAQNRYKFMSNTVIPRPIAWIVTEENGVVNAAPFSYFTPLSSNPATLIVSIGHKEDGSQKDTLLNILETKKATICFVNKDNIMDMQNSALSLPKDESEIEKFGIETYTILDNYPPVISSSQSALFCEYYDKVEMPGKTVPLILEIKQQYVEDDLIDNNNHLKLQNVGRCGVEFKAMVDL